MRSFFCASPLPLSAKVTKIVRSTRYVFCCRVEFKILERRDIPALLKMVPGVDPDPRTVAWTSDLLRWYAEDSRGLQHYSFARVLVSRGQVLGHVSANLIPNRVADMLEVQHKKENIYDPAFYRPLDNDELRDANRGAGSTLLVTSFFWNRGFRLLDDVTFTHHALNRLVRWYEGNTISSVVFTTEHRYRKLVSGIVRQTSPDRVRLTNLDPTFSMVRVMSPWRAVSVSLHWAKRLLSEYPPPKAELREKHKLQARVLHEFEFEFKPAILSGCMPTWSWNEPKDGKVKKAQACVPAFAPWRKAVRNSLGLHADPGTSDPHLAEKIRKAFEDNPRLLAL